ncbi:MAG: T9SS type A sorting domain-containing protein, partial [Ignavibacteriota bacterium]
KLGGDAWTYDNIMVRDFTLMNVDTLPFFDNFVSLDPCYWHVYGAKWVPSDSVMFDPPSPRSSGALLFNRKDYQGVTYILPSGADTVVSAPINLKNASNVWLSFSYQRGLKTDIMKAGGKSGVLIGPDPVVKDSIDHAVLQGDSLVIEALASTGSQWSPLDSNWKTIAKLYGGLDVSTKKFRIKLDSKYLHDHARFRIRLEAKDDHAKYTVPVEDDDNWVLDQIQISSPAAGKTDCEPTSFDLGAGSFTHIPRNVRLITPRVTIANNGLKTNSATYNVHAVIKDVLGRAVYDKTQSFNSPEPDTDFVVLMPAWDIQGSQGASANDQVFTVKVNIAQNFNEYYRTNDTNTFYRTLYIDDRYAVDDGTPDTVGTMTAADNNWFYYDFVPLSMDSLRAVEIFNLGASGNTNWTINIRNANDSVLATRAFSYNATQTAGGYLRSNIIPFLMTGGTKYRLQCIETQGSGVGGDASKGLMWLTRKSFNDPQYAALYPEVVSQFRTSTNADYLTAKRNASAGGPILPMIRLVFQGSSTYLPVELASFTAKRIDDGSVSLAFRTAKEESVAHFEIERESISGWKTAGTAEAKNNRLGADYSVLDAAAPSSKLTYRLLEVDLDGSKKQIGQVAVGAIGGTEAFDVRVYPNPSTQNIHVFLSGASEEVSLTLFDALGKVVAARDHLSSEAIDLDATGLSAGSYWLQARCGEKYSRIKVALTK